MLKVICGPTEFLVDGTLTSQVKPGVKLSERQRATRIAKILMSRHNIRRAEIVPYCMIGDTLIVRK